MVYIVFDLEATCWEQRKNQFNEVIEIGAVGLNDKLETLGSFSCFVKPQYNPILSDFCKNLTSIKQSDVDNAKIFNLALKDFETWITSKDDRSIYLCSWGFYDKNQLLAECTRKGYAGLMCSLLNNHLSIKHRFAQITRTKPCGMEKALNRLNIPLVGTHHRGIDDSKNISEIFKKLSKLAGGCNEIFKSD